MGDYADRVFAVVRRIPAGKVATYGQVARLIGAPRSARYVGYALRANPSPGQEADDIPCHRVVFKDGRMASGFAFGGEEVQRDMLRAEGVGFDDEGRVLMDRFQWDGGAPIGGASIGAGAEGEGAGNVPLGPPPDFDWAAELGEE